jgi:hypothetical protein
MNRVFAKLRLGGNEFLQGRNQRHINVDQPFIRKRHVGDAPRRRSVKKIGVGDFDWWFTRVVNPKRNERLRVPGLFEFFHGHAAQFAPDPAAAQAI